MKRRLTSLGAVALAIAALGFAGCGDDEDEATAAGETTTQQESAAQNPTQTGAAELRSLLTAQLQEHVYLAGIAISNGVNAGLDSKEFKAAADTLDQNSVALSESIGSVYGDEAAEGFLALWREHIGFFVDYTKARAEGDEAAADKAKADLDTYRTTFGSFIANANPELTADAVAEELKPHVESVFATIDAAVEKSPETFSLLREAAGHMPGTAEVLAGAIAAQMPDKFSS